MVVKFPILGEIHLARLRAIGKESLWPGDGVARFGPYSNSPERRDLSFEGGSL